MNATHHVVAFIYICGWNITHLVGLPFVASAVGCDKTSIHFHLFATWIQLFCFYFLGHKIFKITATMWINRETCKELEKTAFALIDFLTQHVSLTHPMCLKTWWNGRHDLILICVFGQYPFRFEPQFQALLFLFIYFSPCWLIFTQSSWNPSFTIKKYI